VAAGALGWGCGGEAQRFVCASVDLCATVPIEQLNTTCGAGATSAAPDGTTVESYVLDSCIYRNAANADVLSIDRSCFEFAANAAIVYDTTHGDTSSVSAREEIGGLGDRAFVRVNDQAMTSQLVVQSRNLFIDLTSFDVTDAVAAKACMTQLASDVLAAQ
jgi:hypothetical protein